MPHEPHDLIALATELEKEDQYNTAKLLRAAAAAIVTDRSTRSGAPSDPTEQARLLDAIAGSLADSPADALSGPFRAAAAALRDGTVPMFDAAPDPHVCRICGHTTTTAPADRCPVCDRWMHTAERFRPIYWARASTPPEAIARLAANLEAVRQIMGSGDPHTPGPDGGWTAHQTLEHLHNAQSIFRGRIDQLIGGGTPQLQSVLVWRMEVESTSTDELLDAYGSLRSEILTVLRDADPTAFWNRGEHEEFGTVTLAEQASYFANHEPTHLAQLADAIS